MTDLPHAGESCKYRSTTGDIWDAKIIAVMSRDGATQVLVGIAFPNESLEFACRWIAQDDGANGQAFPEKSGVELVVVESPYQGDVEANLAYARAAVRDCILRGEAPIASHLLLTQSGILDDNISAQRDLGIEAGLAWYAVAERCVVYIDRGISAGMKRGMEAAVAHGVPIDIREMIDPPFAEGHR